MCMYKLPNLKHLPRFVYLCIESKYNTWYAQYQVYRWGKFFQSYRYPIMILVQKRHCPQLTSRLCHCRRLTPVTEKSQCSSLSSGDGRILYNSLYSLNKKKKMRLRAWSEEFTIYSSAPWLWGKGKVTACSWARAASSLRNSQKMTAQYTAFFTRSASACFSRPEDPPPPLPLNRALCSDWPPSRTCARASWAACRARVGLLVWRRIRSPRDGLRLFTKTRKHYIYKSSHHHFFFLQGFQRRLIAP